MSEQTHSREITITRIFDAPRELVFEAWTNPKHLAAWWGPSAFTNPLCEADARPGGKYHIVMRANDEVAAIMGRDHPCGGEYIEVVRPSRLVFTNNALDAEDNIVLEGLTTVTFEEFGSKTRMTMQTRAAGQGAHVQAMLDGMHQGWSESFDKLERFLAG
ncbi:MAG: SRPBCC domain-containing protein [Rhizomicrobium sp.]